ncbi:type III secretion system stator protein SctL [Acerihabitans arboris]|uniref:HrpE/YscL family type III secretion apparatus protein n=1 Tax=Acerihabitans arboris TaxID=2691583 RepID=A0A845SEI8_9GAMM|nr:type III secretion system stator protein SctL [Acerihabitans arboris]NDL63373.1 HrpE/YscL family type III secretion apparatus protein [Acerihabitans arboris]
MWIVKKIALPAGALAGAGPLLRAGQLAGHLRALDILAQASQQADDIIRQARSQADALLADARDEARAQTQAAVAERQQAFLQQADALLLDWQRQRREWQEALLPRAELLLGQALAQLGGALPAGERLHALLHQLLRAQGDAEQATLWCHPDQQASARAWLAARPHLDWRLKTRARQDLQSVLLVTQHGELSLDWGQLLARLPGGGGTFPTPPVTARENLSAQGTGEAPRLLNSTPFTEEYPK